MRCLIVDDEPLARARLSALLQETQRPVEIVGEFGSARDALPAIHEQNPDVVFVDVQMPVLDGFDLVDLIVPPRPPIVFVTAYDEYAIKAFEVQAIDYLTKPVRLERLNRSLDRIHTGSHRASDGSVLVEPGDVKRNYLSLLTTSVGSHLKVIQVGDVEWIGY